MLDHSARLSVVFALLADANRRAIVEALGRGPRSVGDLAEPLGVTLAAVVQHVQKLEDAGLIETEKQGRVRMCRIAPNALLPVERWLAGRKRTWETRFDRLAAALDAEAAADPSRKDKGP